MEFKKINIFLNSILKSLKGRNKFQVELKKKKKKIKRHF